jgi:hypothetical protein
VNFLFYSVYDYIVLEKTIVWVFDLNIEVVLFFHKVFLYITMINCFYIKNIKLGMDES